ncbi:MAG TPA: hypothetical protein VD866_32385, partial [Urbifossiella sp.]|nr:hypothetical protein [Urbifossiella sp.]
PSLLGSGVPSWISAAGFVLAVVVWVVYVFLMRFGVQAVVEDLRKKAEGLVEEIANDFPAEVADWGGRSALRHAPTVRRLRAELDPPAPAAVSVTATLTAEEVPENPTRKALLLGRLSEIQAVRKATKDAKDGSWVAVAFFWLIGVPLAGVAVFALFYESLGTMRGPGIVMGTLAGLGMFGVGWWGSAKIRGNQDRKWAAVCDRFAADYPRLVETWGGRHVLESPEAMEAVTKLIDPTAGTGQGGFFRRMFGG